MTLSPIQHRVPTLFLKAVIIVIGAAVLVFAWFAFPSIWYGVPAEWPEVGPIVQPSLLAIFATVIPFFIALWQSWLLLGAIDAGQAFSMRAANALKRIVLAAVAMSVLYACAMPLAYLVAEVDDAPGLILIAAAWTGAPLVIATFAAVLQRLVKSAVEMKSEQDLTV
jgi:hypothetical protein